MWLWLARLLQWTPRVLGVTFVLFLSLFATDVLEQRLSAWRTLVALVLHLVPSLVLALVVWAAWHKPQLGAGVFAVAAGLYVYWTLQLRLPVDVALSRCLVIAGPSALIAALYFGDWRMHTRVHLVH